MSRHRPGTKAYFKAKARWERNREHLSIQTAAMARVTPRTVHELERRLRAAHAILRPALWHLSLALVGDQRMSRLHEQFIGIAGPTDVLTFELEHDERGRVVGGEVVVCVPEARRQAHARGSNVQSELLLYALHGMLHLCGFDDRTDRGFRTMHRTEDELLNQIGVGPVFRPAARPIARRKRAAR